MEKLPKRVQRIIDLCRSGETICMMLRKSDIGDERLYWFHPSERSLGSKSFKMAVELGLIEAQNDALLPDIESQTYRLAK